MLLSDSKVWVLWKLSFCSTASQIKKGLEMSFPLLPKVPLLCFSSDLRICCLVILLSKKKVVIENHVGATFQPQFTKVRQRPLVLRQRMKAWRKRVQDWVHSFCAYRGQYDIHSPFWRYTLRWTLGGWVLDWCGSALHDDKHDREDAPAPQKIN